MKFKKGFVTDFEEQKREEEEQQELRQKYDVDDDKVVKVVKLTPGQYAIKTIGDVIRKTALTMSAILAGVGVLALVYPAPRHEMWKILQDIFHQIMGFIGLG